LAPRASDGPVKVPSTGKISNRDTEMKPKVTRSVDAIMKAAKSDLNFVGSSPYMPNVRRTST
jgi:hypothetical protein